MAVSVCSVSSRLIPVRTLSSSMEMSSDVLSTDTPPFSTPRAVDCHRQRVSETQKCERGVKKSAVRGLLTDGHDGVEPVGAVRQQAQVRERFLGGADLALDPRELVAEICGTARDGARNG